MDSIEKIEAPKAAIEHRQNFTAMVFATMFGLQFIFQLLILLGVMSPHDSWYALIVGILSVGGFLCLYAMSSTMTSRLFAGSIVCFEFFSSIARPFLLSLTRPEKFGYAIIFFISALFSFMALYLWTVFLKNTHFKLRDKLFIVILPMPFVINVLFYMGYLFYFEDISSFASVSIIDYEVRAVIHMVLDPLLIIGYWKLCHSQYFSGHNHSPLQRTKLSPLNYYMLAYGVIVVLLLLPYHHWAYFLGA